MLAIGIMGTRTAAGRRYTIRTGLILLVFVAWGVWLKWPTHGITPLAERLLKDLIPGAAALLMVWEFRRYVASLDELAREVQYRSMAYTYLTGLVVWATIFGLVLAEGWQLQPLLLIWFIFLEPVRSTVLYVMARRYR